MPAPVKSWQLEGLLVRVAKILELRTAEILRLLKAADVAPVKPRQKDFFAFQEA